MSLTLSVRQLEPFGVILTNVNLNSSEQRDCIRNLLYENGVVIIPANASGVGALSNDESLLKLARIWEELEKGHNESRNDAKDVQVLETIAHSAIPASFHSDMSWRVNPSRVTLLCGRIIPESGCYTRFRSANLMYRSLSPELQKQLHGLSGIHSRLEGDAPPSGAVQNKVQAIHPLVIKHPDTGVPLLYLNPNVTSLVGMPHDESKILLRVFKESACTDQILSHSWAAGDIVIWDNIGVQHQTEIEEEERCRMHKVIVSDPCLRTKRYVDQNTISESINHIEYYLGKKGDDNRIGHNQWAIQYEHD